MIRLLALLALVSLAGCSYFPAELREFASAPAMERDLEAAGEPSWRREGPSEAYRFWSPQDTETYLVVVVRDELRSVALRGSGRHLRRGVTRTRALSHDEWRKFQARLEASGYWSMAPHVAPKFLMLHDDFCAAEGRRANQHQVVARDSSVITVPFALLCQYAFQLAGVQIPFGPYERETSAPPR